MEHRLENAELLFRGPASGIGEVKRFSPQFSKCFMHFLRSSNVFGDMWLYRKHSEGSLFC